jgi:hypothetical protein
MTETKAEYWTRVVAGHWLLKKQRQEGSLEDLDQEKFKAMEDGILMGLRWAWDDADEPVDIDAGTTLET